MKLFWTIGSLAMALSLVVFGAAGATQAQGLEHVELQPLPTIIGYQSQSQPAMGKDIVETAMAAGNFTTLVKAVQAAGLVDTLKGKGPFTVFAPTDAAFDKLPAGTLDAVLKDKSKLTSILTYHVVAGKVMAADVTMMKSAKTVNGEEIKISVKDGVVMVNDAKVIRTDITASNGVIHVIDTVIMPGKM